MSKLKNWWHQKKKKKIDKLKEAAMKQLYMVRMGDASDETNEQAAISLLKAVSAGAEFDYTDPVFEFWKSDRGVDAMHLAAEKYGNRELFRKRLWSAGFGLCGFLAAGVALVPALAALPTLIPGVSVQMAFGIIGALCTAGVVQEEAFALFDKTKEKTLRLSYSILRKIRKGGKPPIDGRLSLTHSSHKDLRSVFKNLSSEKNLKRHPQRNQQTEHRRKKWPIWYQKVFFRNYQFKKEQTKKVA